MMYYRLHRPCPAVHGDVRNATARAEADTAAIVAQSRLVKLLGVSQLTAAR